jgi:hypothetical protein
MFGNIFKKMSTIHLESRALGVADEKCPCRRAWMLKVRGTRVRQRETWSPG